jgi:hypothetical protein
VWLFDAWYAAWVVTGIYVVLRECGGNVALDVMTVAPLEKILPFHLRVMLVSFLVAASLPLSWRAVSGFCP